MFKFIIVIVIFILSYSISYCQSLFNDNSFIISEKKDSLITKKDDSEKSKKGINTFNLFEQISANLAPVGNSVKTYDLNSKSIHFLIILGKKTEKIKVEDGDPDLELIRKQYKTIDFYMLNRISNSFDSVNYISTDYLMSLQASPLTIRLNKSINLTDYTSISEDSDFKPPRFGFNINIDCRLVPYINDLKNTKFDFAGNFSITPSLNLDMLYFENSKLVDAGSLYIEPTFCFVLGSKPLINSVISSNENYFASLDIRSGLKFSKGILNDYGLLYSIILNENVIGPKWKFSINFSKNLESN